MAVIASHYSKVVLQSNTDITKKHILKVSHHGKERHSMKAFLNIGPTIWNELLTDELRECTSVDVFKKRLTHILNLHY